MKFYYRNKEWLKQKYEEERLSLREIASICGVCHETVRNWLRRLGISVRKSKEPEKKEMSMEELWRLVLAPLWGEEEEKVQPEPKKDESKSLPWSSGTVEGEMERILYRLKEKI